MLTHDQNHLMIITYIGRSKSITLAGYLAHVKKELPNHYVDLWELSANLDILLKYYESLEKYELCSRIHKLQIELDKKQNN